jgi:hypothetical protein
MNNFHQLFLLKKRIDRKLSPGQENDGGGKKRDGENEDQDLPGYPHYSPNEDIYRQEEELIDVDPEDPSRKKESEHVRNDLDVPGSELDDDLEEIGNEDEENNYWSIGGDEHDNLEENRDEDQEGLNA